MGPRALRARPRGRHVTYAPGEACRWLYERHAQGQRYDAELYLIHRAPPLERRDGTG